MCVRRKEKLSLEKGYNAVLPFRFLDVQWILAALSIITSDILAIVLEPGISLKIKIFKSDPGPGRIPRLEMEWDDGIVDLFLKNRIY